MKVSIDFPDEFRGFFNETLANILLTITNRLFKKREVRRFLATIRFVVVEEIVSYRDLRSGEGTFVRVPNSENCLLVTFVVKVSLPGNRDIECNRSIVIADDCWAIWVRPDQRPKDTSLEFHRITVSRSVFLSYTSLQNLINGQLSAWLSEIGSGANVLMRILISLAFVATNGMSTESVWNPLLSEFYRLATFL